MKDILSKTKVIGNSTVELFNVTKDQICEVIFVYFQFGEKWYHLLDSATNKEFDSPSAFWIEVD